MDHSHGNFQLHRFTTSENIAKSFRGGLLFLTHTVYRYTGGTGFGRRESPSQVQRQSSDGVWERKAPGSWKPTCKCKKCADNRVSLF